MIDQTWFVLAVIYVVSTAIGNISFPIVIIWRDRWRRMLDAAALKNNLLSNEAKERSNMINEAADVDLEREFVSLRQYSALKAARIEADGLRAGRMKDAIDQMDAIQKRLERLEELEQKQIGDGAQNA